MIMCLFPCAETSRLTSFSDLHGVLSNEMDWNDEMHPTGKAYHRLSSKFREDLQVLVPETKRPEIDE